MSRPPVISEARESSIGRRTARNVSLRPNPRRTAALCLAAALSLLFAAAISAPLDAQDIDPNIPNVYGTDQLDAFINEITEAIRDILTPATPPLLDTGRNMWRGIGILVIGWAGLRIAYTGFEAWDLMRVLVRVFIPFVLLTYYADPFPNTSFSFPMTVTAGGNWLATHFTTDTYDVVTQELRILAQSHIRDLNEAWSVRDLIGMVRSGGSTLFTMVGTTLAAPFFISALTLSFAIVYAQVIWSLIAIGMLIFLGPLFIPFLAVQPLSFLFWGWFKGLIQYSLYAALAGCLLRIWGGITVAFIRNLSETGLDLESLTDMAIWGISIIPLLVASMLSAIKLGDFAAMIVTGGGGAGSGFLGVMGSAASAVPVAGRVARVGTSAVKTGVR